MIGQLTGGIGRESGKLASTVAAPFTGEELPAYKIPLVGRLYGETSGAASQADRFYENVTRANEFKNEIKGRANEGTSVAEFLRDNPGAIELAARGEAAERQVSKLKAMRHDVVLRDGPDKASKVRDVNLRIEAVMRGFDRQAERLQ